jgi:sugar O-acyltransferase (sialic acid O-acetyltransferase NeuD family)
LVVLGAGGHAKVVISTARAAGYSVTGVLDDAPTMWGATLLGVPVMGPLSKLREFGQVGAVIAIGANAARMRISREISQVAWVTLVHPRACVDASARLGAGSVVFAGAVVHPDTVIGSHTIINTSASVDHDCRVGDYVHLAPGTHLAGNVCVGNGSFLGIGAVVVPGRRVGERAVIGAGACVLRDVGDDETVVGVPARPMARV